MLLESGPVDPRDLLRGDYVILSYKISVLPATLFAEGDHDASDERHAGVRPPGEAGAVP